MSINDSNIQKDRIELIKDFRCEYTELLREKDVLDNNSGEVIVNTITTYPNSDERLIEMITQGIGAILIENHMSDIFKIDLSNMENYKVRDGFIPYGGCLYFDDKYNLMSIEYCNTPSYPGDDNWEKFKFIFKSSLLVTAVLKVHACNYHIIYGSLVPQSILLLNKKNSLRPLMLPFIYNNLEATELAKTILFGKNRYFHRLFAFTIESLDEYMLKCVNGFHHETFIDYKNRLSNENILSIAYFQDASDVISTFFDYTTNYVNNVASTKDIDELVNVLKNISNKDRFMVSAKDIPLFLANYIFIGTVNHEIIGNTITKWHYDPSEISVKLRSDSMQADAETYEQEMLISLATSMSKVPMLMDRISNQSVYYYKMLDALNEICNKIDNKNKDRHIPFFGAHPKKLESTLSQ